MKALSKFNLTIILSACIVLPVCNSSSNNISQVSAFILPTPLIPSTPVTYQETILYSFKSVDDGAFPYASLIQGTDYNFYGTTTSGGNNRNGTIFEITPQGKEKVLYDFKGGEDGSNPIANLIQDKNGYFYGTTQAGGDANGNGTIFEITPQGKVKVLYSFKGVQGGNSDGANPEANLIVAKDGNLYGTAVNGGDVLCNDGLGCGVVFKITSQGQETVLYKFHWKNDGAFPLAGLIQATDGNFYGVTLWGGNYEMGNVFKLTPQGQETVLYSFQGYMDGANPTAGLIQATDGNFYGTTSLGGDNNNGIIFRLTPQGQETVLYKFQGGDDGVNPRSSLIQGTNGNFYGTTASGGYNNSGTIFEVTPQGQETVLYSLQGGIDDGYFPHDSLIQDADGSLYGSTFGGGSNNYGTIFKLSVSKI